jgi:uncharacterized protein (TIGR02145 family)
MKSKHFIPAAALVLALVLTFNACSSDGDGSSDSPPIIGETSSGTQKSSSSAKSSGNSIAYCYGYLNYRDCNLIGGKWITDEQHCLSGDGNIVNADYCNRNYINIDDTPSDNSSSSMVSSSSEDNPGLSSSAEADNLSSSSTEEDNLLICDALDREWNQVMYNPLTEACCITPGIRKELDRAAVYNIATEFCYGNGEYIYSTVKPLCGNEPYTVLQFCYEGKIFDKCYDINSEYNPETEACCDRNKYIIATQFCDGDKIFNKSSSSRSSSSSVISSSSLSSSSRNAGYSSSSRQSGVINGSPITYGGEIYETVVIGTQTWFKRNLNYNPGTGNSACFDDKPSNCDKYGRLYDWSTAMALTSSCNSSSCLTSSRRGLCPSGWHIPSNADWEALITVGDYVAGGFNTAGKYLKTRSGWNLYNGVNGNGLDTYGFSALPGGFGWYYGMVGIVNYFAYSGDSGHWWTSSESGDYKAYAWGMGNNDEVCSAAIEFKEYLLSIRCVKDN